MRWFNTRLATGRSGNTMEKDARGARRHKPNLGPQAARASVRVPHQIDRDPDKNQAQPRSVFGQLEHAPSSRISASGHSDITLVFRSSMSVGELRGR